MRAIVIDIINVGNESFVKTAKGGYNTLEVAYKDNGQVKGKKLVDFTNKDLFAFVKGLKAGDHVVVDIEKEQGSDGREYWQWKNAAIGEVEEKSEVGAATQAIPVDPKRTGKVLGSNYETPEERARRQVLIVRQSSITAALGFLTLNGGTADVKEVIEIASQFEEFVFNGKNSAKAQRSQTGQQASQAVEVVQETIKESEQPVKRRGRPAKVLVEEDQLPTELQ